MKAVITPLLAALAAALLAGNAMAQANDDHETARDRIQATYRADKAECNKLKGHAEDVCEEQAKGTRDIALAELEARRDPGPQADERVRMVRAKAEYEVAKEKCDELRGDAEDRCEREARDRYERAREAGRAGR